MRIVASSDWHADWITSGFPRFGDVRAAVQQVVERACKADVFCFLGDLADPDDAPRALRAAALAAYVDHQLRAFDVKGWWIPGNHDVFEDGSGESTLSPACSAGALVFSEPWAFRGRGVNVVALPFAASSHGYDPEKFVDEARDKLDPAHPVVVLSHLTTGLGIAPGEEVTEMPRGREVTFPVDAVEELAEHHPRVVVLQGHYHRAQTLRVKNFEVYVPGSLVRLTHGEEDHAPSFLELEV